MGGLERSDGGIGADYGVGTIVWVRRRNGSWWPGRILGPEELSASHVMSPRSGTPVKLLGREDASVDWYNLEKSKRVKAFRCGEFDACIERAEASQGIPIKKREKYARREDAILHALELEKQQLEMKKQQLGTLSNGTNKKISGSRKRELHDFSSDLYIRKGHPRTHAKSAGKKSQMIPSKANLPVGEEIYVHKQRSGKQVSLEENVLGDMPRMRGLQDFGLKIFPSKRNISQAVTDETSRKSVDNHVEVLSGAGLRTDSVCHVGGSTNIILSKNKRSQGSMIKESLVERSDRRCPPAQVLHRSAKLPVSQSDDKVGLVTIQSEADPLGSMSQAKRSRCIYFPSNSSDSLDQLGNSLEQTPIAEPQFEMDSLGEECTSSIMVESSDSDSSETDYLEPDTAEDANPATGSTLRLIPVSENSVGHLDCDPSGDEVAQVSGEINNHSIHLSGDIPEMHHPQEMTDALSSKGVSKWHMKGKRNIRHATKRHMDATDEKILSSSTSKWNDSVRSTTFAGKRSYSKVGNSDFPMQDTLDQGLCMKKGKTNSAYDDVDLLGNDSGHAQTLGSQRHPLAFKTAKDQVRNHSGFNDSDNASNTMPSLGWGADGLHHAPQRVCWDEAYEHLESTYADHCTDEWEPKLVDVNLKVQASNYQGEHVPLVSMMSRLNGKAIVGHPVQIETLEDGSIGSLLFRSDALHDGATTPPVWRTGRRTAMQRVPRINPMTSALEDEGIELHNYPVCENKRPPMKAYSGHFSHQVILSKKSISHVRRSASKKVQQKLSKKLNLSNQKTRTLSSIATEHKLVGDKVDAKSLRRNKLLGGLIKSGVAMPLVTCVPVKVAFSRIMEAIGRPPYATAHRIRMTNSAVKNPSGS